MLPFQVVWCLLLPILAQVNSESNIVQGLCEWTVRSKERTIPASVYPVHFFACQSGQLVWEEPYGGIQMTFTTVVPQKTPGTYKVCLTSDAIGFDVFTQQNNKFKLLRSHEAKNVTSKICVSSQSRNVIIYAESIKITDTRKAVFKYTTMFFGNGHGPLRPNDCRICSRQKLISSFCAGDFAVHGNVKSVSNVGGSEKRGEAVVVAEKILHQTVNIFQKSSDSSEILGNVNFPLYCHWKKRGKHGYLFTGNLKDGEGPVIQCRIKFHLWRRLYHKNICDSMIMKT